MSEWQIVARGRRARQTRWLVTDDEDVITVAWAAQTGLNNIMPGTLVEIAIRVVEPQQPVGDTRAEK